MLTRSLRLSLTSSRKNAAPTGRLLGTVGNGSIASKLRMLIILIDMQEKAVIKDATGTSKLSRFSPAATLSSNIRSHVCTLEEWGSPRSGEVEIVQARNLEIPTTA